MVLPFYTIRWDLVCKISGYERHEVICVCLAYDLSYLIDRFGFDLFERGMATLVPDLRSCNHYQHQCFS